ncbi:MAG: PhoU domain-containing protein, partial [Lachnospira sp.]|nr:PhoU domain-containing protein [Lachnospira sp.]
AKYLHCLSNIERISDHAVNIAELAQKHLTILTHF